MQRGAVRLKKIRTACHAVQLPPGSTAGMAVGSEVAQSRPPMIVTARMRAELVLGVHLAWASPRGTGRRWRSRRWLRAGVDGVLTGGTERLLGQADKGLRVLGASRGPCGRLVVCRIRR